MTLSLRSHVMAVDRVERRLHRVTEALDAAGVPYAVIGGNAVAAWVGRVDPGATRATRDVDLLVRQSDDAAIASVMQKLGFERRNGSLPIRYTDPEEPSKRSGVHLVWSDQLVMPSYEFPAPSVEEAVRDPQGFAVLDLNALVRMKLTSFRDIDRVHIADMLSVGPIDEDVREQLPQPLVERLDEIARTTEDD